MIEKTYILTQNKAVQIGWPFWFIGMLCLIVFSCNSTGSSEVDESKLIAQVGGNKLTKNMLDKTYPEGWDIQSESIKNYVRLWVDHQVVILEAEKALSDQEKDFSREIIDYKSSLLRHTYEQKLLDSVLTLEVKKEDLLAYFEKNKKNFELKENIVRVRYVKVPKNHKKLNTIKYLLQYKDSVQKEKFFKLVNKERIFCVADDSAWVKLEELKSLIPLKLYNDEHYLRNYKYAEAPEKDAVWVVYFTENRLKEGVAPMNMVEDRIKAMILNQRKLELIQLKEKELYKKAKANGELIINLD